MDPLTGKQIRRLKSLAHHLEPVVYIGKQGITESLIQAAAQALADHELIKIKFIDFKDEKRSLVEDVVSRTDAALVQIIGNVAVVFRPADNEEKRRIVV